MSGGDSDNLSEVLASLAPLGPEDQFPDVDGTLLPAKEINLHRSRMTVLAMYAQHGSCSYGEISAARLRSILHGDTPTDAERVRFEQAMLEMPADSVPDLAAEIGMAAAEIEERTIALCGHAPGVRWS